MDNVSGYTYGKKFSLVSILKLGILFEIKACEKFYRRHMIDIPRIKF